MRLLVVANPASIHATRFVCLLQEIGHEVEVFHPEIHFAEDEFLHGTRLHVAYRRATTSDNTLVLWHRPKQWRKFLGTHPFDPELTWAWERYGDRLAVPALRHAVRTRRPDGVISLKMQNEGYVVAAVRRTTWPGFPPWLHFNWGTDIEYFGKYPDMQAAHLPKIREVLELCYFHIADCERDARQAAEFGLKGRSLGTCLANGGFDLDHFDRLRRSETARDVILVKGRHWPPVGVAMPIVDALASLRDELRGLRVEFMMTTPDVEERVRRLAAEEGLPFTVLPRLGYEDLLRRYARARFTIAATNVDGTPSFLIESMAMGAVPLHSDLESVREWVTDGDNGLLFRMSDPDAMVEGIRRLVRDDALVARAAARNLDIARARMDRNRIRPRIAGLIEEHFTDFRRPLRMELIGFSGLLRRASRTLSARRPDSADASR
jgi:glycosyltransferase involved in cell wall biosynthesis